MANIDGDARNNRLTGTEANDRIRGFAGNDWLYGLAGRDRLEGGAGRDYLSGGRGADLVIGGLGRDAMRGGSGQETFRFDDMDAGDATMGPLSDVILDFSPDDVLDIVAVDVLGFAGFEGGAPERGLFSIWWAAGSTYVTWNTFGSFHDVELRGITGNPFGQIRWYPDDFLASVGTTGRIAVGQSRAGTIEVEQDADWFRISLEAGRGYDFDVRGAPEGGGTLAQPFVALLDPEGNFYSERSEDFGFLASVSGTYFVQASGGGFNRGTYRLAVTELMDDFAADSSTAGRIAPGQTRAGEVEWEGDVDWFRITLEQGRTYVFDVRGAPDGGGTLREPFVGLLDSEGNPLAEGFDEVGFRTARAGNYFVAASGAPNDRGTYLLAVTQVSDAQTADVNTGGRIAVGQTVASEVEYGGDRDWFRISMVEGNTYTIDLQGRSSGSGTLPDPHVVLRDRGGGYITDSVFGTDATIVHTAAFTGFHYIDAGDFEFEEGTYELSVSQGDALLA